MSLGFREEYNVRIFFITQLLNDSGFGGFTNTPTVPSNDPHGRVEFTGNYRGNEYRDDGECCFCWELLVV